MAQEEVVDLGELMESAQQWAAENFDPEALAVLEDPDEEKVQKLLESLQQRFHGEYVLDLAALQQSSRQVIGILEQYEETKPYALWLRARLDYIEVAGELEKQHPAPKPVPGQAPERRVVPSAKEERKAWTERVAKRPWPENAKQYAARLKPVFESEKVPAELVWIAEVESGFNPRAKSPAGAAGLFQLMPATARQYGLRTWPRDQRLSAEESARAAARHLRYLYGRFKDWPLALAAYNAGEGTVQRAIGKSEDATFDSILARLPAETQMYVPRIEAVILSREGAQLKNLRASAG